MLLYIIYSSFVIERARVTDRFIIIVSRIIIQSHTYLLLLLKTGKLTKMIKSIRIQNYIKEMKFMISNIFELPPRKIKSIKEIFSKVLTYIIFKKYNSIKLKNSTRFFSSLNIWLFFYIKLLKSFETHAGKKLIFQKKKMSFKSITANNISSYYPYLWKYSHFTRLTSCDDAKLFIKIRSYSYLFLTLYLYITVWIHTALRLSALTRLRHYAFYFLSLASLSYGRGYASATNLKMNSRYRQQN